MFDPVRVGQEPHVHHQVDVERNTVPETERGDRDLHGLVFRIGAERVDHERLELMHVHTGGVDHHVGDGLHWLEQCALAVDGVGHSAVAIVEWVLAATAGIPLHQFGGGSVEIEHTHAMVGTQSGDGVEQCTRVGGGPGHQTQPIERAGVGPQFHDLVEQLDGQVVDHEPTEVFEMVGSLRAAGPREPGDDEDVGHDADGTRSTLRVRR